MESGQEQNYWPGFVDALSNVVLTLVFVLVVFVFALSMSASKVEKRMQEVLAAEQAHKAKLEALNAGSEGARAAESNLSVNNKDKAVEIVSQDKQKTDDKRGQVAIAADKVDEITLSYPAMVLDLDDASAAHLQATLETVKSKLGTNSTILVRSVAGSESYSVAQRLAYYRAIKIRNILIEKGIAPNEAIRSKIVQPTQAGLGHVEIIFQHP